MWRKTSISNTIMQFSPKKWTTKNALFLKQRALTKLIITLSHPTSTLPSFPRCFLRESSIRPISLEGRTEKRCINLQPIWKQAQSNLFREAIIKVLMRDSFESQTLLSTGTSLLISLRVSSQNWVRWIIRIWILLFLIQFWNKIRWVQMRFDQRSPKWLEKRMLNLGSILLDTPSTKKNLSKQVQKTFKKKERKQLSLNSFGSPHWFRNSKDKSLNN